MSKTLAIANGDWYVNPRGQGETITGRDKAVQDFGMYLLCDKYGGLNRLIGRGQASKPVVAMAIQNAIGDLQAAQSQDQTMTAAERIVGTSSLEIAIDGRDVYFVVDVTTGDKQTVTVADGVRYRLPQPGVSSGYTQKNLQDLVTSKII